MLSRLFLLRHSHCKLLSAVRLSGTQFKLHCCMTSFVKAVTCERQVVDPEPMSQFVRCKLCKAVTDER